MKTWLRQHRLALAAAARKLGAQTAATLASVLVIGIAISLPLGGYVLLEPLRALAGRVALEPQVTVYMQPEAGRADAEALASRLRSDARVARVRFIAREEALKELASVEGVGALVASLDFNPLPDALVVRARDGRPEALEGLAGELRSIRTVAEVHSDSLWARRLAGLAALARLALVLLATLLAFGLLAVTFNTIRLQILTLRDEIELCRLLGATDSFIRRPYYYLGTMQGALGGIAALAIVWLALLAFNRELATLGQSYGSVFNVPFLSMADAASVVLCAGLLGWLGAHMSVSRHLRDFELA